FSTKDPCNLSLARAELQGSVNLGVTNTGPPLSVLVMAEDHGTNIIENVGVAMIPSGGNSARFDMFVPTATYLESANSANTNGEVDLFATANDLFGGVPDPYTGHTIAVLPGVPSSVAPPAGAACPAAVTGSSLGPMACDGHGSVTGSVSGTFSQDTSVIMSKGSVGLMTAPVSSAGAFSFCAPAGAYTLARSDDTSSTQVTLTPPLTTIAMPCSSICQPSTSNPCLLCQATTLPPGSLP
ncbi:MAG: hypothetical protein ACREQN_08870, partial [Candidatus Binataceae bacterium]